MNHHALKILPEHYANVDEGTKTFEIRKNDRGFQKGDTVSLHFWPRHPESDAVLGHYDDPEYSPPLKFNIGDVYPIDSERVVFSLLKIR